MRMMMIVTRTMGIVVMIERVHDRGMVIEMVMMITGIIVMVLDGGRDDHNSGEGERDDDGPDADSDG